ncbi:FxsA family protein [Sporosarcina luteola]|uniref:FxsA family protein n=1 Tax=Bacillales TaxID=1385 RepID=UPI00203C2EA4|nr:MULTISPECIES: FxsA family protein [Bacillales]MCM3637157.1 FxsA family protein [Sporosarcina luteola]
MKWLLPLFILVPAAEIMILLYSGNTIGIMPTLLLILVSGIGGAYLAKRQGFKALADLKNRMGTMEAPGNAVIDGVCIFFGAILLIMPGFITDIAGLLLLFKWPRKIIRPFIVGWIYKKMKQGRIVIR